MPIHDWTRVRANRFHHFHQSWTANLAAALNSGRLPPGFVALAEQITGGPESDVVALELAQPAARTRCRQWQSALPRPMRDSSFVLRPPITPEKPIGSRFVAYIEPVAVGDILPDRPIFLTPEYYVNCPLEATYQATSGVFPAVLKASLERPGAAPESE